MKPLGLVPGHCEAYGDVSTCVRSNFLSEVRGLGRKVGGGREMFKMRWWGKGVVIKTSFMKLFQGG